MSYPAPFGPLTEREGDVVERASSAAGIATEHASRHDRDRTFPVEGLAELGETVIDLGELKRVVTETVVDRFDHADLNADPLFRDRVPTTENIALAVWDLLAPKLGPDRLAAVRVWEDSTLFVDYDGS